jgi:hypothetical protein
MELASLLWAAFSLLHHLEEPSPTIQVAAAVGLSPQIVAAAGANALDASAMLATLESERDLRQDHGQLQAAIAAKLRTIEAIATSLEANPWDQEDRSLLAIERASLASLQASLVTVRMQLRDEIADSMPQYTFRTPFQPDAGARSMMAPVAYRQSSWVIEHLQDVRAAKAELVAIRGTSADLPVAMQDVLSGLASRSEVAVAQAALETHLQAVTAVFVSASHTVPD